MNPTSLPHRLLTGIGFLAVLGFTGYQAMGTNVFGRMPWPQGSVDYHVFYDSSLKIVQTNVYPDKHAYPPSAIAIHYLLAQIPFAWSAGVYLALTILAAMSCWWLLLRFFPGAGRPGWLILALPALAISQYYLSWDLRSQNCNLIVCACTLAGVLALFRDRPLAAGFWLALSFSLKLFAVLLIPYLLWRGKVRAFAWTMAFIAFFWFVLPLAVFSPAGLSATYQDWLRQMRSVGAERPDVAHPILISLHNAAYWLFAGDRAASAWFSNGFRLAWLVLGVAAICVSCRRRMSRTDAHGLLAEVSLLLLGPIAVSPYLEPYHAVPFIIPAFLLMETVTDPGQHRRWRVFGLVAFAILLAVRPGIVPFVYRGVLVNLALLLATAATILLAAVRRHESAAAPAMEEPLPLVGTLCRTG